MRGPALPAVPANRTRSERFDLIALDLMDELWARVPTELGQVQLGIEEVPFLPNGWGEDTIPLSTYVEAKRDQPARIVLLRRPIERRAPTRAELEATVLTVLVEQIADILGLPPEDVHPDYEGDV
jgi:hypothetical protein